MVWFRARLGGVGSLVTGLWLIQSARLVAAAEAMGIQA